MKHPIQKLAYDPLSKALYLAVGERIQKFDSVTGDFINEWIPPTPQVDKDPEEQKKKKAKTEDNKHNVFRTLSCSSNGQYVVGSTDEQKSLVVLRADLSVVNIRNFPKRPSAIDITSDSSTILLGDKFGDVYAVPICDIAYPPTAGLSRISEVSESESGGELDPILGHVSMLVDLLVAEDQRGLRHIISSDRDEHIRVTKYPETYIIETFCFGHEQYVSQLLVPSWSPNTLISGGGDDFLAHWDWTTGELLEKVDIHSILYPKSDKNGSEEQIEEVAVSGIWQVPELQLVLAYDETVKLLLVFKLHKEAGELKYINKFSSSILDVAVTGEDGKVWLSIDDTSENNPLIQKFTISEKGEFTVIDSEITQRIFDKASFTIASRDDVVALHSIALLRKHAEH
ncbi:uncharacterized protein V1513DRAFT_394698 [Lipomyces chichibuensis]|uniref:uncharacterized protein n=1 Tax=Lipomyces chichibuensis TaxID=1546026 RepID=UPI003343F9C7